MSLKRKVKRHLKASTGVSQVDLINEKSIREGLESGATSVKILHPTMGYRKFSLGRIQSLGGIQSMWNMIATTLLKCSTDGFSEEAKEEVKADETN